MKSHRFSILVPLAAACLGLAAAPQADADPTVRITVAGVSAPQGFMMVALHDEKGWSGAPIARARVAVAVAAATVTLSLPAPAPGRYGVKLFHDVNGDGKMETNIMGFPAEPFGFSNDATASFGPPDFSAAAFEVGPSGAVQTVTLK